MRNIIKVAAAGCLCLLMILTGSCSMTTASNPNAEVSSRNGNSDTQKEGQKVSLFDNRFSFVPPDGFKLLPAAEIKRALSDNAARGNIYSNADQTAYVIVMLDREMPLDPAQLPEVKGFTERLHKNYAGWKTSEIIDLNGRQWYHFEWEKPVNDDLDKLVAPVAVEDESEANSNVNAVKEKKKPAIKSDKPVYYREFTTSLNKQMLNVVFEADADQYPKVKEAFNKSLQTIQIKD